MNLRTIKKICGTAIKVFLFSALISQPVLALEAAKSGDFAEGSKTWSENCARCHNIRSPSDLRDDQWVTSVFHMRIRAGLTGQETRDVLTFLQATNAKIAPVDGEAQSSVLPQNQVTTTAVEIYENNCLACHGVDGKGNLPGVPDFTDPQGRLNKPAAVIFDNVINGFQSPDGLMPMPARGGNSALSNADISAVLDYINNLFSP